MFSRGYDCRNIDQLKAVFYYLGIRKIPCLISSPLRKDNHPSFTLFMKDGTIFWKDMATGDRGTLVYLMSLLWNCTVLQATDRINKELSNHEAQAVLLGNSVKSCYVRKSEDTVFSFKTRDWNSKDEEYWRNYGVSLKFLKMAGVYPIIYYFYGKQAFKADTLAYVFIERKEGKLSYKLYQPKSQYVKWRSTMKDGVISLWNKIPHEGDLLVICSSLKDSLCLWNNLGIPSINLQGEGYNINEKPLQQLKERFKNIVILYDNDEAGIKDAVKLSEHTGFPYIKLPYFKGGKDVSDLFKCEGQPMFNAIIGSLFRPYIFNY
jgi:hypothetical protein